MNQNTKSLSELKVVAHNSVLKSRFRLNPTLHKLIMSAIALGCQSEYNFSIPVKIDITQFIKEAKMTTRAYTQIKSELDSMTSVLSFRMERWIERKDKTKVREWVKTNWVDTVSYIEGQGEVNILFSRGFEQYLVNAEKHFTIFNLGNILNLRSSYSIRFYELLKCECQEFNKTSFTISLEDIRIYCDLKGNQLINYKDFRVSVLEVSEREINSKTDIGFSFKPNFKGRKVVSITFVVWAKKKISTTKPYFENDSKSQLKNIKHLDLEKTFDSYTNQENKPEEVTYSEQEKLLQNQTIKEHQEPKIELKNHEVTHDNQISKTPEIQKINIPNAKPEQNLSGRFMDLEKRFAIIGISTQKAAELVEQEGFDYLEYIFKRSSVESRSKIQNRAGYFVSLIDMYRDGYKEEIDKVKNETEQEELLQKQREERELKERQEEEDFREEQPYLAKDILFEDPKLFMRAIYRYLQKYTVDFDWGYTYHPEWNINQKSGDKEKNLEIAKEIRSRFLQVQTLREFRNLIEYSEEWLFLAVFNKRENFDPESLEYYKSPRMESKLVEVRLPFQM